ncbi:hypothetical protein KTT66_06735 [Lacticaseibacillus casei]|uniref:Uncharacterized protein n=1 Tax=Lacticaseibacillus huelsenbergensis TaxID=3035291 RepID=A0ABY8DLW7_9LACO|nr:MULTISPECIES: hypothetical protein [Lacticaseibacillus]MDG3061218.1 hypothetical protein [Lacticaseibacillus sp. BCRC 81376]QVI36107.1 hypothetical protein KGS74_07495 [Lacticaseibacillus casei]QXG60479.1 hypothetical protein KTT66_06735 [Lacticaseibacillus casei]WFB37965.1 hypothetical protein LHUE1_001420 [Lacticaseibacillus huelsenbergensis]WFB42371.1 hypothetical protein LHUE2_000343 [Lacticaseibacillus huelsenbergensis]
MKNEFMNLLPIPQDFHVVETNVRKRNRASVTVERFQDTDDITPNNKHLTVVTDQKGHLISFNSSAFKNGGHLPAADKALEQAITLFNQLDPDYAAGLSYMRTERQERHYEDNGVHVSAPVYWIKFAHRNGSYNWVTIGPDNQVIEVERESLWDYFGNRRATEMWNNDNWVLAREGKAPQLSAPDALA